MSDKTDIQEGYEPGSIGQDAEPAESYSLRLRFQINRAEGAHRLSAHELAQGIADGLADEWFELGTAYEGDGYAIAGIEPADQALTTQGLDVQLAALEDECRAHANDARHWTDAERERWGWRGDACMVGASLASLATAGEYARIRAAIRAQALLQLVREAAARVELANAEGDPILSAWLADAKAQLDWIGE